jgi:hypothetical protein
LRSNIFVNLRDRTQILRTILCHYLTNCMLYKIWGNFITFKIWTVFINVSLCKYPACIWDPVCIDKYYSTAYFH